MQFKRVHGTCSFNSHFSDRELQHSIRFTFHLRTLKKRMRTSQQKPIQLLIFSERLILPSGKIFFPEIGSPNDDSVIYNLAGMFVNCEKDWLSFSWRSGQRYLLCIWWKVLTRWPHYRPQTLASLKFHLGSQGKHAWTYEGPY